ncbi:hypothetical protein [Streptosporangium sp. NPDC000396]|uniref:hypothetical protein n=1 Tax=Streptosporangium sp. NPDC000396 TaxID=3366185 RepID=UPI0036B154E3
MDTRTPDGRTLSVNGNSQPFMGPWAFMVWVHGQSGTYRLHTGAAGSTELVTKHTGEYSRFTVREVAYGGNRIVSHEDTQNGGTTLLWIGPHHEVSTFVAGTGVPVELFIDLLGKLDVQDTPEGVTVIPRPGSGLRLGNLLGANTLGQVCAVTVKPVDDVRSALPRASGKRVRGGSLWRNDERDPSGKVQRSALLVNDTTATTMLPFNQDDPKLVSEAESISFTLN